MSQAIHDRTKLMYPFPCTKAHLDALCAKGKLTEAEYKDITGEDYDGEPYVAASKYEAVQAQLDASDSAIIELYELVEGGNA